MQVITPSTAGNRLGSALGTGLEKLAESRTNDLQQRYQQQKAYSIGKQANLSDQDALLFSQFPLGSKESISYLSNLWQRGAPTEEKPNMPNAPIQPDQGLNQQQAAVTPEGAPQQQIQPGNVTAGQPVQQQQIAPTQNKPLSSFYRPPLEEQRKQREAALKEKEFEFKQMKHLDSIQDKVRPFIEREYARLDNAAEQKKIALSMRDTLVKNKDKWPDLEGYLPDKYFRDADIRDYARQANNLVVAKTNTLRGAPTNLKTKLVQAGKIDLSLPYAAQLKALDEIIRDSDTIINHVRGIEKIREESGGYYPGDIASRLYGKDAEREMSLPSDLPREEYESGSQWRSDINGKLYEYDNGWQLAE